MTEVVSSGVMTELDALKRVLATAEQQAMEAADNGDEDAEALSDACVIVQKLIDKAEKAGETSYGAAYLARNVLNEHGYFIWQELSDYDLISRLRDAEGYDENDIDLDLVRAACERAVQKYESGEEFSGLLDYAVTKYEEYLADD
jgi:hypothetical protein